MPLTITDAELMMLPVGVGGMLTVYPHIQQRVAMDSEKVEEYAALYADGHDLGRLVVFQVGEQWILADGFHRVHAARRVGLAELPCAVYQGTLRDAILYATSCNLHGKPLSNADKRKRVQTLLTEPEWAQWSDNAIAKHCGVTQPFVGTVRKSLITVISEDTTSPSLDSESREDMTGLSLHSESSDNGTSPTRRTYRDRYGKVRTMDTSRVGHAPPAPPSIVTVTEDGWTMYDPPPREPALVLEPEAPEADETTASTLTERERAYFGPRTDKEPGTVAWCWQTIGLMQSRWEQKARDEAGFDALVKELKQYEAWKVVPPEEPYGTLGVLLQEELGLDRFSAAALAPDHPLHDELVLPSKVDQALHEAMGNLESLEEYYRTARPLFEVHQQGYLALKDVCLRFAVLFDPAVPQAPAPAPQLAPAPIPTRLRDTVGLQQAVWLTVQQLEPCTNAQVKDALGERRAVTHQALQALVKQGKVVKAGETYRVVDAPA